MHTVPRSEPSRDRRLLAGCAFVGLAVFLAIGLSRTPSSIVTLGVIAVLGFLALLALIGVWKDIRVIRAFRSRHGADGKDLLIVYSDSPVWGRYIEEGWIARWSERAVVLNRSSPAWSHDPDAQLWRRMAGRTEHTPVAIVVPRRGQPKVIRFYLAFRDFKHGRRTALNQKERELEAALESAASLR
jgi:hypothetical protein